MKPINMDSTNKLIELFKEFPGIGPRQAKRFVYFLLNRDKVYVRNLAELINQVRDTVHNCELCFRFFPLNHSAMQNGRASTESALAKQECVICRDPNRENKQIMLVSHDIDLENIEKSKNYKGYYFVLGGTVPILEKTPEKKIRQKELIDTIEKRLKNGLKEIILALNYNPEGENTLTYLSDLLSRTVLDNKVKISTLGRGLSTGTELEYSDSETIKNALKNRQ